MPATRWLMSLTWYFPGNKEIWTYEKRKLTTGPEFFIIEWRK